jgi:hypothetical protein
MKANKDLYDFSDYPKDHKCYDETNKKERGKFKDECKSYPIKEFVSPCIKMHSIIVEHQSRIKRKVANATNKCITQNVLKHKNYVDMVLNNHESNKEKN